MSPSNCKFFAWFDVARDFGAEITLDTCVFHTPMGHADYSMKCVGFIATLQRGTEWAATGEVTIDIPKNFPSPEESASVE